MKTRVAAVVCCAALFAASPRDSSADGEDLGKTLAAAVDLPMREARLVAATKLSERNDVTLDAWLAAMRKFGEFQRPVPGQTTEKVTLQVGAAREETTIAVHVPKSIAPGSSAPLLLAFHGAGGEGRDCDDLWAQVAEDVGMIVVAPTDPSADLGYRYTEVERQRALAALRWARRTYDVDENRVYLTGVSRGGHLSWDIALRDPDPFAAFAPMIGGPRLQPAEGQNNIRYMENVAHLPLRDLQGLKDDARLIDNLRLAFKRLEGFGAKNAKLVEFPDMAHDFDPRAVDWKKFLTDSIRTPTPLRVVRSCCRLDEARAFWVEVTRFWPTVAEKFRADIDDRKWKAMDDDARRDWVQGEADKRTARIEAKIVGVGKFSASTTLVQRFRLLLAQDMFDPAAPVEVTLGDKTTKYACTPSKAVLLREFVERFDRTFLPVVEVSCP